jgi:isopenicillin N synthase-like dioxygenase
MVIDKLFILIMQALSNGIFKSADHQAVVNSSVRRQSVVTFYNPHPDSIVYPLDALTATKGECHTVRRFEPYVYREFYQRKMTKHLLGRDIKRSKGMSLVQQPEV